MVDQRPDPGHCCHFFSWVWWVTFLVSLIGMTLFQILWYARMRATPIYTNVAVAGITSAGLLAVGIYVLVAWKSKVWCDPFIFYTDHYNLNDDLYSGDYCEEKSWFAVALVCAILWAGAAVCMLVFVKSGRHAKWESKHTPAEMELAASAVVSEQQQQAVVANVAVKVLESEKVDETV